MAKTSVFTKTETVRVAPKARASKAKPTAQAAAETVDPQAQFQETVHAATESYAQSLGLPSGRRVLISTFVALIVGASSMYWAIPVIELALLGALTLSGSVFLGFLVYLVGILIAVWSSAVLGTEAFKVCVSFDYQATKTAVTEKVSTAKSWFSTNVLRRVAA